MHELSLALEVLRIVEQAAQRDRFDHVAVLRLEAGELAAVDPQALRFALDSVVPGTCLDGARIEIDETAGRGRCNACGAEVPMRARTDACPSCGAWGLHPVAGTALRVRELLVSDDLKETPRCA